MIEDQVTSIEQSNKLISLGIPAENASMAWTTVNGYKTVVERDLCLPENIEGYAFTVADLLGILPEIIEDRGHLCGCAFKKDMFGYTIEYYCNLCKLSITFATYDTAINAVVYAVEWIAKNGYSFTNKIVLTKRFMR